MPSGIKRFTKTERERAKLRAAELDRRGWTTRQIAAELGVDHSMVCRYLQSIRKEYKQRQQETTEEKMAYKRDQLRDVLREAMIGWDWSKGEAVESLAEQVTRRVQQLSKMSLPIPDHFTLEFKFTPDNNFLRTALEVLRSEMLMDGLTKEQATTMVQQVVLDWSSMVGDGSMPKDEIGEELKKVEQITPRPQVGLKELKNGDTSTH
jgi:transposase